MGGAVGEIAGPPGVGIGGGSIVIVSELHNDLSPPLVIDTIKFKWYLPSLIKGPNSSIENVFSPNF